jgi:hypothetical protein
MTEELKECQLCHQMLPKSDFYKRKDRNGEYNWMVSYCKQCEVIKVKKFKKQDPEKYKEYNRQQSENYYSNNKNKVSIIQKRYYYNKLPLDKKEKYKQKIYEKYPDIVDQICNK